MLMLTPAIILMLTNSMFQKYMGGQGHRKKKLFPPSKEDIVNY